MRAEAWRSSRGQLALDLIPVVLLVMVFAVIAVHGLFLMLGASFVQEASRDGARAYSQKQSYTAAVEQRLPDWIDVWNATASVSLDNVEVTVTAVMPVKLFGVTVTEVTLEQSTQMRTGG